MVQHLAGQRLGISPIPRPTRACRYISRNLNVGGAGFGGGGFYWDQRPKGEAFNAKISQQRGSHYLKAGTRVPARATASSYV